MRFFSFSKSIVLYCCPDFSIVFVLAVLYKESNAGVEIDVFKESNK